MLKSFFLFTIFVLLNSINCQNERDAAIQNLFSKPSGLAPIGYEEVTSSTPGGFGAVERCGEGSDQGIHTCIAYHMCDGRTNTIIQDGRTDGFGVIDIRFGANSCNGTLEVCCKFPEGGLPPTSPLPPISSSTTGKPFDEPTSACGIRNNNGVDFKITGNNNNEAEYGEFPWMVAVLKANYRPNVDKNLAICGGALIHPRVVLTGAHCVYKNKNADLKIRAGEWDTQTDKERLPYEERNVANIIYHDQFHPQTLYNDVALLVLSEPVQYAQHIGPLCLPQQNQRINSRNCFATGWGKDVFGREGKYQVILKKIELPLVHHEQCQNSLRTTRLGQHFNLDKSFICAGGEQGKDTCTGDGGSPLICPDPQNPSRYVQAGIVAWGIGCGEENIPGVYADVSKFRDWIDNHMKRLGYSTDSYVV